jgi:hypothetical protein
MPTSTVSGTTLTGVYVSGGGGGGGGGGNGVYYAGTGTASTIANTTWSTAATIQGGQLELKGDQADVVINGVSLTETLQLIQDRLNMLRPNTALEAEWDQLRELGEQYRRLEAELKEKQRAWEILRKQG